MDHGLTPWELNLNELISEPATPATVIHTQRVKMGGILLGPKLCSKVLRTTNINLVGLAQTGIEYVPIA